MNCWASQVFVQKVHNELGDKADQVKRDGEGNATPLQYSCLEIPWTEEPGRLQSMGWLRVRHDWATSFSLFTFMHWRRKWQPTPVFLPGESQGWGSLVGCRLWGRTESDTPEATTAAGQEGSTFPGLCRISGVSPTGRPYSGWIGCALPCIW